LEYNPERQKNACSQYILSSRRWFPDDSGQFSLQVFDYSIDAPLRVQIIGTELIDDLDQRCPQWFGLFFVCLEPIPFGLSKWV
jgi:hypothetical protein